MEVFHMRVRVLDVGNCDPDHAAIRRMLQEHFEVDVDRVMFVREALERLGSTPYALVLVNREIFDDGSPGIELVKAMQADPAIARTPVMLVSNFADAQAAAVAAGARPGFGKAALRSPETLRRLGEILPLRADASASTH
jgi:PleD family two-component response regulator